MTCDQVEIPMIGRIESAGMELLQAKPPLEHDRRLENWIASNLDATSELSRGNHWNSLIKNLPVGPDRSSRQCAEQGKRGDQSGGWSRFHLVYRKGVTIVRLIDQALVQQTHIEELGKDLMDLIAVGNHRVVLNFSAVERLGSWIIGVVGNAHRACAAVDGGCLKLCGLDASLAEIFEIVGMARDLEVHPDEAEALDSPWPASAAPHPLPVDILRVLLSLGEPPPIMGGAPVEGGAIASNSEPATLRPVKSASTSTQGAYRAALRVCTAGSEPRLVRVPSAGLTIGRESHCRFRIGSAQVSKQHAVVEARDGKVFVRDLGSTNGTSINGQVIRSQEREVVAGDTIQIGPVSASVVLDAEDKTTFALADVGSLPLSTDEPRLTPPEADARTAEDLPCPEDPDSECRIRTEVIEEVLVVTPQFESLTDPDSLAALRSKLQDLFESRLPRRLVVNLEFVGHISRQAVALLLSHHLRLDWAGGGLRVCQAHARIMALMDQVRLTMLVDCFPTLDEAVLASWSSNRPGAGQS